MMMMKKLFKSFYVVLKLMTFNLVSKQVMTQLITALILSRLDYCNSLLIDVPASTIAVAPLQRVQNTAARLVLGLDRRPHITPAVYVNCIGFLSGSESYSK